MSEMRKLAAYFAQFDGTEKEWDSVKPYFEDLFHKDCQIVTVTKAGEGVTTYDEWAGFLKQSLERKADIQMTKLEDVGAGVIEYKAALKYPDRDPIHFASRGEVSGEWWVVSGEWWVVSDELDGKVRSSWSCKWFL